MNQAVPRSVSYGAVAVEAGSPYGVHHSLPPPPGYQPGLSSALPARAPYSPPAAAPQSHHHHIAYGSRNSPSPGAPSGLASSPRSGFPGQVPSPRASRMEYNPQAWGGPRHQTGGQFVPHSAMAMAAPANPENGDPNPPPPYTEDPTPLSSTDLRSHLPVLQTQSLRPPMPLDYTPISAITVVSPFSQMNPQVHNLRHALTPLSASQPPQSLNFAPPPNRDRSSSRSNRFGLSALARGLSSDRSRQDGSTTPYRETATPTGEPMRQFGVRNPQAAASRASVYIQPTEPMILPPTSRRSASAGPTTPSQSIPGSINWQQTGLHLPPPPPGPPPAGSRSASSSSIGRAAPADPVPILSLPTRRPRQAISTLGPVPPTPAGWTEHSDDPPNPPPLPHVDYEEPDPSEMSFNSSSEHLSHNESSNDSSGFRNMDKRDSTVKGIRERRSESRQAKDRMLLVHSPGEISPESSKLADLKLNLANSNISRQGAVKNRRPSAQNSPHETKPRAGRRMTMTENPTTKPSPVSTSHRAGTQSAPVSGDQLTFPLAQLRGLPVSASDKKTPGSRAHSKNGKLPLRRASGEVDSFAQDSIKRHQDFIEKESQLSSDKERLELFAEYIVMESRMRRTKYTDAFSTLSGSDLLDLTRDLWRKMEPAQTPKSASTSYTPLRPKSDRTDSFESYDGSSPMSSGADWTPRTESESPSSGNNPTSGRYNNAKQYNPILSPIPSMAMSTVPDEAERERGRTKSRWWESESGSVGNGGRKIERSKRESKYMGLHPDARFNLQYEDDSSPSVVTVATPGRAGPSNEYPPEKAGWHDEDQGDLSVTSPPYYSVPNTPSATFGLDVSRLVTLPPPYPRHYPAMSNAHPDLASFRTVIRQLNEITDVQDTMAAFTAKITRSRAIQAQEAAARSAQAHHSINEQVRLGQISYSTAAAAEEQFRREESEKKQAAMRAEFDTFAPEVQTPLNALLSERITKASTCIAELRDGLATSSRPDAPMEEGDEKPELLEKLKLLKWLVEAREALHRQVFDLETDRSSRFRDLVLADLRERGEPEAQISDAERFFRKDARDRWATYERAARGRFESLQGIVQKHVDRGVQDQLSAFWDIAPRLLEVVQRIPDSEEDLERLRVSVPHKEISENPGFGDWPLQYLYGLLRHADKATYQFIENQVGLMCLSHEVGMAVMSAGVRVLKTERCAEEDLAENDEGLDAEMVEMASYEETRLTRELKEKVSEVEGQWEEALGDKLKWSVDKVESVLREMGGWDDGLED